MTKESPKGFQEMSQAGTGIIKANDAGPGENQTERKDL